ncbi:MAG: 3-hydroxyacyl-ACP dehydratase FabZ [Thermoanaerobaculum sp.]
MLDIKAIMDILPHRYPFLLVDRVLAIHEDSIVALKNVTYNEPFFQGHFPGAPVLPGVLLVEAMAQAGGVLMLRDIPDRQEKLIYFTGIDRCRFRRPVVPGDQVIFEVRVLKKRSRFAVLSGVAKVDGEVVAEAELSSAMVDRG